LTNAERADRLLAIAGAVGDEMRLAAGHGHWNLAVRRAQEVVELTAKGLLNEMGFEYPRSHDPIPELIAMLRQRGLDLDPALADWWRDFSSELADVRAPAFYQEISVHEGQARTAVAGAEKVLTLAADLLVRLRRPGT
jgi:HEPN domain-containing protein